MQEIMDEIETAYNDLINVSIDITIKIFNSAVDLKLHPAVESIMFYDMSYWILNNLDVPMFKAIVAPLLYVQGRVIWYPDKIHVEYNRNTLGSNMRLHA